MSLAAILRAYAEVENAPPPGVTVLSSSQQDLWNWTVVVEGGKGDSVFAERRLAFVVQFPHSFPLLPPIIMGCEKGLLHHPNVDAESGRVVFALVSEEWRRDGTVCMSAVLQRLREVITTPELENAVQPDIACEWRENQALYRQHALAHLQSATLIPLREGARGR